MKELWLHIKGEWEQEKKKVQEGIESGFVTFYVEDPALLDKIQELAAVKTALKTDEKANDGKADILISREYNPSESSKGSKFHVKNKEIEKQATEAMESNEYVVISTDEQVIPLENLIAKAQGKTRIIAQIQSLKEAETVLGALEVGADGILFRPENIQEVDEILGLMRKMQKSEVRLESAEITGIQATGMGSRVCVDTCSMLEVGEGALVGSQSNHLFLVHSESVENPYVETRPFRINAGPVHSYILMANGKTKYLSEIEAGDEILIADKEGETRKAIVGRAKIEERPLMLIKAEKEEKEMNIMLQNAETIRLVKESGNPVSVAQLEEGDKVLVQMKEGGRHFGEEIEETITEK